MKSARPITDAPVASLFPAPYIRGMTAATFYRRVWRWHFWAGLVSAPVLIVTALTGAVYVFKDEMETTGRSDLARVTPSGERRAVDDWLVAVREKYPEERPSWVTLYAAADRAAMVQTRRVGEKSRPRLVFVDPYTGRVTGDERPSESGGFFGFVIDLHTSLYAGRFGRLLVELVTSWSIVLVVTGLYLWWPKKLTAVLGVWVPRVRGPVYTLLRDWHAVSGTALSAVAVAIALTGLFFTQVWGWVYSPRFGDYPFGLTELPPASAAAGRSVPVETVVREARNRWPDSTLRLQLGDGPHAATVSHPAGDRVYGFVAVDRATGEVTADRRAADVPLPERIKLWVYPIHVGSVYGTPTKVLAVLGCLMLIIAAVTGMAMWLVRRPIGQTGFPAPSTAHVPRVAVAAILLLAILLPVVGLSLVVVIVGEWVWEVWKSR